MGRQTVLADNETLAVSGATATTKLHEGGEKWAIVFFLMRVGGKATVATINEYMHCDSRKTILRLFDDGWLVSIDLKEEAPTGFRVSGGEA